MVQKSSVYQLRLVVSPIIYRVFFASSQVVGLGISEAVSIHFSMIMLAWPGLNSVRVMF